MIGTLIISTASIAGDWTPLLQENCKAGKEIHQIFDNSKAAPKALRADIVKNTTTYLITDNKVVSKTYCQREDVIHCDVAQKLTLKNAQAFGVPIREIYAFEGYGHHEMGVVFRNNRFERILPQFWFRGLASWRLFAIVQDHRDGRVFKIPHQDLKKYESETSGQYDITTKSTPTLTTWQDDVMLYSFFVDKKNKSIACSSGV